MRDRVGHPCVCLPALRMRSPRARAVPLDEIVPSLGRVAADTAVYDFQWRCACIMSGRIDFARVNRTALAVLPSLLARWLPGGRYEGAEYVALNPRRVDHRLGSFRINTCTGRWADFAIDGARGGDVVSLFAYLAGIRQVEAAQRLADIFGIDSGSRRRVS
jgi:hypothetical protein